MRDVVAPAECSKRAWMWIVTGLKNEEIHKLIRLYTSSQSRYNMVVTVNTINSKAVKGWYRK